MLYMVNIIGYAGLEIPYSRRKILGSSFSNYAINMKANTAL